MQLLPYTVTWILAVLHFCAVWKHFHSHLLLSEVSKLNAPPSSHTAKGGRLDIPVFKRIGKQTDACIQVLLVTGPDGTEVVDSHTADFVAMEENHLNRQKGFVV